MLLRTFPDFLAYLANMPKRRYLSRWERILITNTSSKLPKAKTKGRNEKTKKENENGDRTMTLLGATPRNALDQSVPYHQPACPSIPATLTPAAIYAVMGDKANNRSVKSHRSATNQVHAWEPPPNPDLAPHQPRS